MLVGSYLFMTYSGLGENAGKMRKDSYVLIMVENTVKSKMFHRTPWLRCIHSIYVKVLEKCTKNLTRYSRLDLNNHESNIDC